jgi:hypothetical protein
MIESHVYDATVLPPRYLAGAAWQSMDAYLNDWEAAYDRLGRQLVKLRAARNARKAEKEAGTWPCSDKGSPERR